MRNDLRISLPRAFTFACLACLCATAPALAKQYMTPGFLAKTARPMSLAVLPPHADFIKQQAVMTADMVKEAQALEDEGALALGAQLKAKGYTVRVLTLKDVEETPGLKALVTTLNGRYDEEWSKILRKPREVRKGRYSVGEDVVKVCSLLKVDGLVMSRVVAVGHTGGRQALTMILSLGQSYAQSYARIGLSVLEGKAGHVEGYFEGMKNCTTGALLKKPDKVMSKAVEDAIDHYPGATEIKIVKNAPETVEAASDDKEKPDDAAISDFEAVLKGKESKPPAPAPPPAEAPSSPPAPETQPPPSP